MLACGKFTPHFLHDMPGKTLGGFRLVERSLIDSFGREVPQIASEPASD
jgi:hypothetical protein